MAPSVQQLAEDISHVAVDPVKLSEARKDAPQEDVIEPPKEQQIEKTKEETKETPEEKPYIKRQIDLEGGTTTASVLTLIHFPSHAHH